MKKEMCWLCCQTTAMGSRPEISVLHNGTQKWFAFFYSYSEVGGCGALGVVNSGTNTSFLNEIFLHVEEHEESIAMPFCEMSHPYFPLTSFPWFNDVSLRLVRIIASILGMEKLTYRDTMTSFTLQVYSTGWGLKLHFIYRGELGIQESERFENQVSPFHFPGPI